MRSTRSSQKHTGACNAVMKKMANLMLQDVARRFCKPDKIGQPSGQACMLNNQLQGSIYVRKLSNCDTTPVCDHFDRNERSAF